MKSADSVEDEDFPGRLLHQAALWDNCELLEDLLHGDQRAYINSLDNLGRTPLHAAAVNNKSKCLGLLLSFGADPNIRCGIKGESRTALHMSAESGFVSNVLNLLQFGASLVERDRTGLTALDLAERGQHADCVSVLQQAANERENKRQQMHSKLREACISKDIKLVKVILADLGPDAELIVNMAPNGANTLLFLCSESCMAELVSLLLSHGADGRVHPVTKYSPLYMACYNGHVAIAQTLLQRFPELVRVPTVERWLPIHAAVIGGHFSVLELLLSFPYPPYLLDTYWDPSGEWEYELPFDVNVRDATGQSVLYLACVLGNLKLVQCLLQFHVKATRAGGALDSPTTLNNPPGQPPSPARKRISDGIQNIMSRLNLKSRPEGMAKREREKTICPMDVNQCCGETSETPLQVAVREKQTDLVTVLLQAGADPNISAQRSLRSQGDGDTCSNPLMEACKNHDVTMVELLLRHGARDDLSRAQCITVRNGDLALTAKLLSCKANADPEYKLNKKAMTEQLPRGSLAGLASLTYSSVFPNVPVMVNWHGQRCQLEQIKSNWLIDAALHLNPKLKLNPKNHDVALYAITRLDISSNALPSIPIVVLQLPSLRYLNLSQNKLEKLPSNGKYNLPVLEELHLQNNRLETLPDALLSLPCLTSVDVSNNKITHLPPNLWTAPSLKEFNAAFNLLRELPTVSEVDLNLIHRGLCAISDPPTPVEFPDQPNFMLNRSPLRSRNIQVKDIKHQNLWSNQIELTEQIVADETDETSSRLTTLNLAHNLFTSVPPVLACLAVSLTRLNMSYNNLRSMSHITTYPATIKQLDLSSNSITVWPSLPQVDTVDEHIVCYSAESDKSSSALPRVSGNGLRNIVLHALCTHRRHVKLDNLRTLVLADNALERIQLATDEDDESDWDIVGGSSRNVRSRLMFPNLSMLDISNNKLRELPHSINELSNLSVLNLAGNNELSELPAQLGLLSRLWNLNTQGCNLQEPLRSMIHSNKYKTMDVIGYLKSVLEDAKTYARIKLMIVGVQGIGKTSLLEQLRQEGSSSYRRRPHEHWAKRMGNKHINVKTARGTNMSTVGVDIGVWVYDKKGRGHDSKGPVVFRTWDFGGQKEYYATHQYFLSKRSLYLVVWKIPDGERGLREVRQWLVNIQARAPNSPVLIVGTHYDEMAERGLLARSEDLQQLVRDRFINIVDAEKCGLPRVLDSIEVSCRSRHNIRLLCNLIYDTVYSLRPPGSKELLLEQRVPASYLTLEDVVTQIAAERRSRGVDPVLNGEQYKNIVTTEMQFRYRKSFRDQAELHQATIFLHENGVLLHYEDSTLRDLYFLDPQWLCDMLAHVVTVREINPFARTGVMKMSDLPLVFKSSGIGSVDARGYIVSLLNKFEVALTWDNSSLLIPSLLPSEEDLHNPHAQDAARVKIPVRSRGWAIRNKKLTVAASSSLAAGIPRPLETAEATLSTRACPERAVRRLLLMSYFPSGFWSRLITRVLADDAVVDIVRSFLATPREAQTDVRLAQCLDQCSEWLLWQTGMELRYGSVALFQLREAPFAYRHVRIRLLQDGSWCDADLASSCLLEMYFPSEEIVVLRPNEPDIILRPSPEAIARLLTLAVDHVDTLLEDWYPTLGTRFVHTSEGKFLVTRLVPCPRCLLEAGPSEQGWLEPPEPRQVRQSTDSAASGDSGVGHEGHESSAPSPEPPVYSWMVEECILAACEGRGLVCPVHGEAQMASLAPDTMFLDLGERHLIRSENVTRGALLGRGAFGFVFRGTCRAKGSNQTIDVAMKMLQPVPPGRGATQSALVAYKVAKGKWDRDPLQYACKAYCTARQELNILLSLRHPHIVPLVGMCTRPLALILDLAPQGALDVALKTFRRSGAQFTPPVLQQIVLQVARALEYLHQQHIIYRDLKSENVLVWSLPPPFKDPIAPVHVKLADYGISRQSLASGSKGFGGTEGFMAPEMVRYNGEEEYTEKVDCFSFGMFLYELLTLHQPFEGHEAVKECVLEGGRPPLTPRGTQYPSCILDLMVLCWSQAPKDRPSASQIVSMAAAPEFVQLLDCACVDCEVIDGADCRNELWVIGGKSMQVLQANATSWTGSAHIASPTATAIALVGKEMWLGDAEGNLHVYDTQDFSLLWNYALGNAEVKSILPLEPLSRVAVGLTNGRLFIVRSDGAPTTVTMAEGSFVLTELGSSEHLTSLTCVERPEVFEIWVGESEGYVSVYTLTGEIVTGHDRVNHYNPVISEVKGVYLSNGGINGSLGVLSHVSPGCMVYLWDTSSRQIAATLDCTKLVPCSESLKPLTLDDLSDKCQVTCICQAADCVYIGTAWGCIVVAELATLYPVTVFRPFEAAVTVVRPLNNGCLGLAGKGYRSLAARSTDMVVTPTSASTPDKPLTTHIILWKHSP